ncbi:uncharacterized protein G2W53_029326 [Senna tora]|uniref:Uncharacterized protein n=1 Tax=Senna tora TaxID=362788 RepID=A0A834T7G2_9FABA|nr:uncharacterized protein G2W53_029326 [Senna tora]
MDFNPGRVTIGESWALGLHKLHGARAQEGTRWVRAYTYEGEGHRV